MEELDCVIENIALRKILKELLLSIEKIVADKGYIVPKDLLSAYVIAQDQLEFINAKNSQMGTQKHTNS